jgi:serine O-acetyltransferase
MNSVSDPATDISQQGAPSGASDPEVAAPATVSAIWDDLVAHTQPRRGRARWKYTLMLIATALLSSGFHMVALWRFGALFHRWGLLPLSFIIEKIIYHWYHCLIPCSVRIGPGLWVPHPLGIVFSSKATLGRDVWVRQHVQILHVWAYGEGGVVGDRASLNTSAMLLKGARVGHDAIIAAGAIVTCEVPPAHLAIEAPAAARPLRPDQRRESIDRTA